MAPESVKKMEYTRFSDIWSIGCLVIEMITGEPPWSNYKNPMAVLFQLYNNNNPPPIPDKISDSCKDFLTSCLQIEPMKRANVYKLLRHPFITGAEISKISKISKLDVSNLRVSIFNENIHASVSSGESKVNSGDSKKSKLSENFFRQESNEKKGSEIKKKSERKESKDSKDIKDTRAFNSNQESNINHGNIELNQTNIHNYFSNNSSQSNLNQLDELLEKKINKQKKKIDIEKEKKQRLLNYIISYRSNSNDSKNKSKRSKENKKNKEK